MSTSSTPSHVAQRARARAFFEKRGIRRALLCSPATVKWLTGFAPPTELGVSPFTGGPALVTFEDGGFTLLVAEELAEHTQGFAGGAGTRVVTYAGYTIDAPLTPHANLAEALRMLVGPASVNVGVELRDLPWALGSWVDGAAEWVAIDGWAEPLRAVKTADEIQVLRHNFHLADVGQEAARHAVKPGVREIDVFSAVQSAIQAEAGERVPIGNDFIVGRRERNIGGWPCDHSIEAADAFIADISTVRFGYWSDGCATYYASGPTERQRAMHAVAYRALEGAAALLRPGVIAREIDAAARRVVAAAGYPVYPHHTGHGVGVTGHEAPRIVPYSDEVLAPGMVVMLEPGIYLPGETAVRLEHAYLITDDGAERLTSHDVSCA